VDVAVATTACCFVLGLLVGRWFAAAIPVIATAWVFAFPFLVPDEDPQAALPVQTSFDEYWQLVMLLLTPFWVLAVMFGVLAHRAVVARLPRSARVTHSTDRPDRERR
jgi:hypothetical protein